MQSGRDNISAEQNKNFQGNDYVNDKKDDSKAGAMMAEIKYV